MARNPSSDFIENSDIRSVYLSDCSKWRHPVTHKKTDKEKVAEFFNRAAIRPPLACRQTSGTGT
jgi:hypothetical protein